MSSMIVESLYRVSNVEFEEDLDAKKRYDDILNKTGDTDFHVEAALDYMYGTDRNKDIMYYTDEQIEKALDYYWENDVYYLEKENE